MSFADIDTFLRLYTCLGMTLVPLFSVLLRVGAPRYSSPYLRTAVATGWPPTTARIKVAAELEPVCWC